MSIALLGALALEFGTASRSRRFRLARPASAEEGPEARWYDDYFTVEQLDAKTWAIGEPRYEQQVFNYLIVIERALRSMQAQACATFGPSSRR